MIRARHTSPSGFTLVELLTAIAVIAVLGAILIAAMPAASRSAHRTECASNLRQLGQVFSLYAIDHSGMLPAPKDNYLNENAPSVSWMTIAQEYIEARFPKVGERNILLCPSAQDTFPDGKARRSYGMNAAGTDGKTPFRLSSIDDPAQTLLLADTRENGAGQGDGVSRFGINNYSTTVEFRHDGQLNALFFDGHVESIDENDPAKLRKYVENLIP